MTFITLITVSKHFPVTYGSIAHSVSSHIPIHYICSVKSSMSAIYLLIFFFELKTYFETNTPIFPRLPMNVYLIWQSSVLWLTTRTGGLGVYMIPRKMGSKLLIKSKMGKKCMATQSSCSIEQLQYRVVSTVKLEQLVGKQ